MRRRNPSYAVPVQAHRLGFDHRACSRRHAFPTALGGWDVSKSRLFLAKDQNSWSTLQKSGG
jgi:hypothetical protein